jgi:hypothetical protein
LFKVTYITVIAGQSVKIRFYCGDPMQTMSKNYDGFNEEQQIAFSQAPPRLVISLEGTVKEFCEKTGFTENSQQVHEITRQCFDIIDVGFMNFQDQLNNFPLIGNLIENQKYVDSYGLGSDALNNLKKATYSYGLGIYFACRYYGIFLGERTPYMLEHMEGNACLLLNASNLPNKI